MEGNLKEFCFNVGARNLLMRLNEKKGVYS